MNIKKHFVRFYGKNKDFIKEINAKNQIELNSKISGIVEFLNSNGNNIKAYTVIRNPDGYLRITQKEKAGRSQKDFR